jgi:ribosomal protein L31E
MSLVCSLLIYQSVWRQSQTAILNRMRVRIYKEREREGTGRSIG